MDRQCLEAAQSGWTSDYSRVAASGFLAIAVAGDAVKAEDDEGVAQLAIAPLFGAQELNVINVAAARSGRPNEPLGSKPHVAFRTF